MWTITAKTFDFDSPSVADVDIETVAHALAAIPRWGAQTRCGYSVAQHSLMVESLARREHAFAALLDDAAEAYTNDIVSPLKLRLRQLAPGFLERIEGTVAAAFGIPYPKHASIRTADSIAAACEARDLFDDPPPHVDLSIVPSDLRIVSIWSAEEAEWKFMEKYLELKP